MANEKKCGLRYCAATVGDYDAVINDPGCPCMKCLGDNFDKCDIYKKSLEMGIDFQRIKCMKCKHYNGR